MISKDETDKLTVWGVPLAAFDRIGALLLLAGMLVGAYVMMDKYMASQTTVWRNIAESIDQSNEIENELLTMWGSLQASIVERQKIDQAMMAMIQVNQEGIRGRLRAVEVKVGVAPPPATDP